MSNTATTNYNSNFEVYEVKVNGITVYGSADNTQCTTIKDRLNRIFSDTNRDLDFITPSIVNGLYVVCCPLVRKNVGQNTYLYDTTSSPENNFVPEKMYEATNWQDNTDGTKQTAILTISSGVTSPWNDAIRAANLIRSAVTLNFNDLKGNSTCKQLIVPTNITNTVNSTISSNAVCNMYGIPCQGTSPGTTSPCPELGFPAQNILNPWTGNGEVFHPQDLTCAMTSTNSWNTLYKNKFIKVTNTANNKSIVVRVTDTAPANKGVELTYRAWLQIGKPTNTKIELMK